MLSWLLLHAPENRLLIAIASGPSPLSPLLVFFLPPITLHYILPRPCLSRASSCLHLRQAKVVALGGRALEREGYWSESGEELAMVRVRCAGAVEAGQVAESRPAATMAMVVATAAGAGGGGAGGGREPAGLPCPRCESTDTKFCYYNNYNLGQPRHFCRACRRYWTRGGALRNVPVGGGQRKASPVGRRKRGASASSASAFSAPALESSPAPLSMPAPAYGVARPYDLSFMTALASSPMAAVDPDRRLLDLGGSFSSLLAPAQDGHFSAGFLVGGLAPAMHPASSAPALLQPQPPVSQPLPEGIMWSMGWPDLSI